LENPAIRKNHPVWGAGEIETEGFVHCQWHEASGKLVRRVDGPVGEAGRLLCCYTTSKSLISSARSLL
jgi:hypothetical protein